MYVTDLITRIETAEATIHCLKIEIIKIGRESIRWEKCDFEAEADRIERRREMPDMYNHDEFQEALERMIEKHDPEIGITWKTVRCYLNEHCLRDK